jgi:hypothetical protein
MRSLTIKIVKLMQIVVCICLFIGCNLTTENSNSKIKEHCGEKGYLTVVIKYVDKVDTLCLLPEDVITNQMVDSVTAELAQRIDNYNPVFINMIINPKDNVIKLSKSRWNGFDFLFEQVWEHEKRDIAWVSFLNINEQGMGAYHASADPGEKPFEIQFTPAFAKILQKLKNQK